ncbi:MAG: HAD family hydrolase [Erysipelotrichaceae bacterium]|jgi:putative hydrolase of the HAD superfamily|nr:HAD family hydrolase [Erysipelotrichaceae bacterium]MBQ2656211.1 HAD family hydrolase [Erysipelotrichaceae bacterium]MBQ5553973.1 HAD family hydrolase [Erysipelotrichaceae bacterium]MBQ5555596.1 HAD family hydrolase [Erysipelotrichaceae bacterium]MBR4484603.1 HAD family hydrolase [Erysipelotrichaceae bacterium]
MIKAVIFDFDGTLSNRMKNAYEVFRDYFRPFFKDMNEMEYEAVLQDMMYFDCNGIIDVDVRLIPFFRKYGSYLPSDFEEKFVPFYYENMYTYTMLREETIEVLENLKKKYKLAILSNGDSSSQHNKIKKVNIEGYFDEVIVSGDLGIHKPDARIFDIMAKRLGVKNEECLMIGDVFATDILGAYRANMTPVWVVSDPLRPAESYKGYRIEDLRGIYPILEELNKAA